MFLKPIPWARSVTGFFAESRHSAVQRVIDRLRSRGLDAGKISLAVAFRTVCPLCLGWLLVTKAPDDCAIVTCTAGCALDPLLAALDLEAADLFFRPRRSPLLGGVFPGWRQSLATLAAMCRSSLEALSRDGLR